MAHNKDAVAIASRLAKYVHEHLHSKGLSLVGRGGRVRGIVIPPEVFKEMTTLAVEWDMARRGVSRRGRA